LPPDAGSGVHDASGVPLVDRDRLHRERRESGQHGFAQWKISRDVRAQAQQLARATRDVGQVDIPWAQYLYQRVAGQRLVHDVLGVLEHQVDFVADDQLGRSRRQTWHRRAQPNQRAQVGLALDCEHAHAGRDLGESEQVAGFGRLARAPHNGSLAVQSQFLDCRFAFGRERDRPEVGKNGKTRGMRRARLAACIGHSFIGNHIEPSAPGNFSTY